jgi:hypothetical protein
MLLPAISVTSLLCHATPNQVLHARVVQTGTKAFHCLPLRVISDHISVVHTSDPLIGQ